MCISCTNAQAYNIYTLYVCAFSTSILGTIDDCTGSLIVQPVVVTMAEDEEQRSK